MLINLNLYERLQSARHRQTLALHPANLKAK